MRAILLLPALTLPLLGIHSSLPGQGSQPQWTQVFPPAPPGRIAASLTYCPNTGRSLLFGGSNNVSVNLGDTWEYDALAGVWAQHFPATAPSARDEHRAVYDSARGVVYLFGGRNGGSLNNSLNDLWSYDCGNQTWTAVTPLNTPPGPRYSHAIIYDSVRDCIVVCGGASQPTVLLGDTWEYDPSTRRWASGPLMPQPRYSHTMAYDPWSGHAVMFGGFGFTDTWEYVGSSQTWMQVNTTTSPPPRNAAAMSFESQRSVAVMFGGSPSAPGPSLVLADTWEYNFATHEWTDPSPTSSPIGRVAHAMTYDETIQSSIFFGGGNNITTTWYNETWEFQCPAVTAYGAATPHCSDAPKLHTRGNPTSGNGNFAIRTSEALPSIPGVADAIMMASLFQGTGHYSCANNPSQALTLNVLPTPFSPIWVTAPMNITPNGRGAWPLPIPPGPGLIGFSIAFQFYENHPTIGCPCMFRPGVGGSASRGLRVTIY